MPMKPENILEESKSPLEPTLENFAGDFDYTEESTGDHIVHAPNNWSSLFWPQTKTYICETTPEQRLETIKNIAVNIGRVAAYFKSDGEELKKYRKLNSLGLLERLGYHFRVGGKAEFSYTILAQEYAYGKKCGIFTDGEEIPDYIAYAVADAKAQNAEDEHVEDENVDSVAGFLSTEKVDLDNLPPVPLHAFSKNLQVVIEEVSASINVPHEAVVCILLALASACIGRARGVKYSKAWKQHANLYLTLIMETGLGKSPAIEYIFKDVRRMEAIQKSEYKRLEKDYQEALQAYKKNKKAEGPPPQKPIDTQYLLDDATIEAALGALEDNPRGLFWLIDEFSGFFQGLDRYNKNASGDGKKKLLSAWDSKTVPVNRRPKDGFSENRYHVKATFGLLGGIQPHLMHKFFTEDDTEQGWPQRFLYVRAITKKAPVYPIPEISDFSDAVIRNITERLLDLNMFFENGNSEAFYLDLSPEAKSLFDSIATYMSKRAFGTKSIGYVAKLKSILLRLSLIVTYLDWSSQDCVSSGSSGISVPDRERALKEYADLRDIGSEITLNSMEKAVNLLVWLANHTENARRYFPGGAKESPQIEKKRSDKEILYDFIKAEPEFCEEWHTASEILKKMGRVVKGGVAASYGKTLKNWGFQYEDRRNTGYYKLFPLPE